MGMDIRVDPRVLIPRPETELLIRTVADLCREKSWKDPFILDVGTGSGIIPLGLTRLMENCRVFGVDVSYEALAAAGENIREFKSNDNIKLMRSDMFEVFGAEHKGIFDVIVSNPPYISDRDYEKLDPWVKAEPRIAVYGGKDGMDHLQIIGRQSGRFLSPGGFIAVEVAYDQAKKVKDLFIECGFTGVAGFRDFNNYERVIVAWNKG